MLHRHRKKTVNWAAVARIIAAAQRRCQPEADRVRSFIDLSKQRLVPLQEPFTVDFGAHRWLQASREETYSDWLAWILEQLPALSILRILGAQNEAPLLQDVKNIEVARERWITLPEGPRKIDILISMKPALFLVELKVVSLEHADLEKNKHYAEWLRHQRHFPLKKAILIAPRGNTVNVGEFELRHWDHVCRELRKEAVTLLRNEQGTTAAMVLAFVGAVEQNLMRLSTALVRRVLTGQPSALSSEIFDYIRYLEEAHD